MANHIRKKKLHMSPVALGILILLGLFVGWRFFSFEKDKSAHQEQLTSMLKPYATEIEEQGKLSAQSIQMMFDNPSTRNAAYEMLRASGSIKDVPDQYATRQSYSEAKLIHWLSFPTELGEVPAKIVHLETKTRYMNDIKQEYTYELFKFRSNPPHWAARDGWLVGIVGPFVSTASFEQTLSEQQGSAFSRFDKLESKTLDQHLDLFIQEVVEYWKNRSTQ